MDYDVLEAKYLGGYRIWLRFRDGTRGDVDLQRWIQGPVFEPLKDPDFFRRFSIDRKICTIVWPNGADIAPETLHEAVRRVA